MALRFVALELVISEEQIQNLNSWTTPLMVYLLWVLIQLDVAMESAWMNNKIDFASPFFLFYNAKKTNLNQIGLVWTYFRYGPGHVIKEC